jgi:arabinose-5-phosphate isomerase
VTEIHETAAWTAAPERVLRREARALLDAADRMDTENFARAVELIVGCDGKVIVTGTGTSGIVARKIAATLTSTGTPSAFLHPSDALHGGLGLVASADVVIAISNSGETDEILALLPYLRARDTRLIGIVGNAKSRLAEASTVVLDAWVEHEACPLGLAPTASSTLALALGDGLAVDALVARGLTSDAFARNHPSGRLGRRLTLRVQDLMHGPETGTVRPDSTFLDTLHAMSEGGLGAVAVTDPAGRLIGIVTDGDIRRALEHDAAASLGGSAADLMTAKPRTTTGDALAYEALTMMEDGGSQISVLPVLNGDHQFVGMLRLHDVVQAGL